MPTGVRFCGGGGSGGGEAGNSCHSKSSRVQLFTPNYTPSHFHLFFLFFSFHLFSLPFLQKLL